MRSYFYLRNIIAGSLILILFSSCVPATYLHKLPSSYFQYQHNTKPAISAHRGGGDYFGYPENCIESFSWLSKQMPVIIECDVRMTNDSVLVMMHDDNYNRTTTGKGKISDSSYAYSQTVLLKDNLGTLTKYKVPTLGRVLNWGKDKVAYTLDIKRGVPFEKVIALIQQYKAENFATVITYTAEDAATVHRLDPNVMISVTIRNQEEYNRHKELNIPDNRMVAFVGTREPDAGFLETLHAKGIRCILGTLGNLDKMAASRSDSLYKKWSNLGADIMSTDRPIEAWKVLK